jgi:hypothetical protein
MNNNTIPIDHISSEQYSNIDNQQNDTKLKEVVNEMKKSPMTPTPLYVSFSILIQIFHHGGQHIQLK